MPLQETSGAASYDAFGGGAPVVSKYIEDFFQTRLRFGTGSSTTVTTGLNGVINETLVWTKSRNNSSDHKLTDNQRGATNAISSNLSDGQATDSGGLTAFSSTGYTLGGNFNYNNNNASFVDWQFIGTPKFFDIVIWSGNNAASRAIPHNLDSVPGCIMVKGYNLGVDWSVYHRGASSTFPQGLNGRLNSTGFFNTNTGSWADTAPTSTTFTVGADNNNPNYIYVAYLFAHNAGGFGPTGTDNAISCGSYTGNGSNFGPNVTLGYEPQWVLIKGSDTSAEWRIFDNLRGMSVTDPGVGSDPFLDANGNVAEGTTINLINPTATGFIPITSSNSVNADGVRYIYIAIRRGPMRVPTTGASVFTAITRTGTGTDATISSSSVRPDFVISKFISGSLGAVGAGWFDRLRGATRALFSNSTNAESAVTNSLTAFLNQSYTVASDGSTAAINFSGQNYVNYVFTRAPGFFDEVCYTGTGGVQNLNHNLGAIPELMIVKRRDSSSVGGWYTYSASLATNIALFLNDSGTGGSGVEFWNNTRPTATQFTIGSNCGQSNGTYVNYLFASCPGVSRVGSYTGTGATQTIDCGFTTGAKFVLIKRTDSTGDWFVWDTARGMVAGTDPRVTLNISDPQVNSDWVFTVSTGFQIVINNANVNASGGNYIFLAIA